LIKTNRFAIRWIWIDLIDSTDTPTVLLKFT